jgi:anaerobic selenocysteine-containing dehydrogenase
MPNPPIKRPLKAATLDDMSCVFQTLAKQYGVTYIGGSAPYVDLSTRYDEDSPYSVACVEKICGTPAAQFEQICEAYAGLSYADNKAGTMLYAMGWTQHTVGSQNIRTATIIQSLPATLVCRGADALRGWHNVQGATDHGLLQQYLPGYLGAPTIPRHMLYLERSLDLSTTYLKGAVPTAMDPDAPAGPQSSNWWGRFGTEYNRAGM